MSALVALIVTTGGLALSAANNSPPGVDMAPPEGVPAEWENAGGALTLSEFYGDDHPKHGSFTHVSLNLHDLSCLHPDFYVVYVILDGGAPIRGLSFNSDCSSATGNVKLFFARFVPPSDWLENEVTVEVWAKSDDGDEAQVNGTLVLSGTYTPSG